MLNVRCFHWVIVATILVVTTSVVSAFPQKVDVLNAREDPFSDAPVAFKLNRGTEVTVLDSLEGWGAIKDPDSPGETFWVSLQYLSESPVAPDSGGKDPGNGNDGWGLVGILLVLAFVIGLSFLQSLSPLVSHNIGCDIANVGRDAVTRSSPTILVVLADAHGLLRPHNKKPRDRDKHSGGVV